MNAAVFFLPFAKSAAEAGTAAVQQLGDGLASAGSAFADMRYTYSIGSEEGTFWITAKHMLTENPYRVPLERAGRGFLISLQPSRDWRYNQRVG